jgi:hypothetical protein
MWSSIHVVQYTRLGGVVILWLRFLRNSSPIRKPDVHYHVLYGSLSWIRWTHTQTNILRIPFVFLKFLWKCMFLIISMRSACPSISPSLYFSDPAILTENTSLCRHNCVNVCYLLLVPNRFYNVFRHPQFVFYLPLSGALCCRQN